MVNPAEFNGVIKVSLEASSGLRITYGIVRKRRLLWFTCGNERSSLFCEPWGFLFAVTVKGESVLSATASSMGPRQLN